MNSGVTLTSTQRKHFWGKHVDLSLQHKELMKSLALHAVPADRFQSLGKTFDGLSPNNRQTIAGQSPRFRQTLAAVSTSIRRNLTPIGVSGSA